MFCGVLVSLVFAQLGHASWSVVYMARCGVLVSHGRSFRYAFSVIFTSCVLYFFMRFHAVGFP